MPRLAPALALAAAAATVLLIAGCGDSQPEATPLTREQARLLAGAQFLNYKNKGAEFEMEVGVPGTESNFMMKGQMNWAGLVGYGVVTREGAPPVQVWWREDMVIQSHPALAAVLRAADRPEVYVAHRPNPQANPIDKAAAILMHLGSRRRENALLVRQKKGSAYLGNDDVRGTPTQILRYGEINTFWIDPRSGLMQRFAGNNSTGKSPQRVDLLTHERQVIYAPPGPVVNGQAARQIARSYGITS